MSKVNGLLTKGLLEGEYRDLEKGSVSLVTIAGPEMHLNTEEIVFKFGDKVLCTVREDSSEKEIFEGLMEFISCFDGNLKKMIDDKVALDKARFDEV